MAQARMPMKLAFISALTGLSTTLSSRLCSTSVMPPGALRATSEVLRARFDGKAMLATTATTAAAKVPNRYNTRIGRIWVSVPCLWLAIEAMTRMNTRIGATALRAETNTLPMKPRLKATSGAIRARAIPATRPIMICRTRLVRFNSFRTGVMSGVSLSCRGVASPLRRRKIQGVRRSGA
ncbi:hypothetical protein D3C75_784220 [compost metagenome]